MRSWKWIGLIAAALAVPAVLIAAGPAGEGKGPRPGARLANVGEGFVNRFDANDDGQVSEGEWMDAFRTLDLNSDGVVTKEELAEKAKQAREEAWNKLDKDGDGALSIEEFPGRDEPFARLDADGDGLVTKEEVAAAHEKRRGLIEQRLQHDKERFEKLDTDGDGTISLDEFPSRDERFKRADTDGDGKLTQEEMAEAHRRMRQHRRNQGAGGPGGGGGPRKRHGGAQ